MIELPGKTPWSKLCSNGISSWINFGTTVSHTDQSKISCSQSLITSYESSLGDWLFLFKFPAETRTDFNAQRPKS